MAVIIPSIASADPLDLKSAIAQMQDWSYLHLDIEDGNFVPNITFGLKTARAIATNVAQKCDAHLMTTDPLPYITPLSEMGIEAVCFHWESCSYPSRVLESIRQCGMRAGIALNPRTRIEELELFCEESDYILLMTSEPDGKGELFQPRQLKKIRWLKEQGYGGHILVDGGIGVDELNLVEAAGADCAIMGRAVFRATDPYTFLLEHSDGQAGFWD